MDLEQLRDGINNIDHQLMELLDKRLELVKQVGVYKKENELPIVDNDRQKFILEKANNFNNSASIKKIYQQIFTTSCEVEDE